MNTLWGTYSMSHANIHRMWNGQGAKRADASYMKGWNG